MDQRTDHQKIFLVVFVIIFNILSIEPARADEFSDFENEAFSQSSNFEKTSAKESSYLVNTQSANTDRKEKQFSHWHFLLPMFVVHGLQPEGGVESEMPRKLDPDGRSVATPGFGFEYKGKKSLDALIVLVKDCYDNYAGSLQIGQYFKIGKNTEIGYTAGLYIRETPITCFTSYSSGQGGSRAPIGLPVGGIGGRPPNTNSFSSSVCVFSDNLPIRYTTTLGGDYIDIIPSPFLSFSTRLYDGAFKLDLKIMGNFYLNEVGLSIPL